MKSIKELFPVCIIILSFSLLPLVDASEGDRLPDFSFCLQRCYTKFQCEIPNLSKRDGYEGGGKSERREYVNTVEDSLNLYELNYVVRTLFGWDCSLNCKYKCVRYVTEKRVSDGLRIVQFFGKWPFIRIWGITEFFSTIFSIANFYANYVNIGKIHYQYSKNKRDTTSSNGYHVMYFQYLTLLVISCIGWTFSTIFHIRDTPLTETLDYFGAIAIIMCNFNVIVIRYFNLYLPSSKPKLLLFQASLLVAYLFHVTKLLNFWDYVYNVKFNLFFGLSSLILWILHAKNVQSVYLKNFHIYSNSIQLLPFETKILAKLDQLVIPLSKKPRLIPLLPIFLNAVLLFGILLEMIDFVPIYLLVDAHSLWHLVTIFPSLVWFDWNIWDMELMRLSNDVNKFN